MSKATLTSKGQVTVPREIRERLGLSAGDKLLFEVEDGSIRLKVLKSRSLGELQGSLPAKHPYPGKEGEREAARRSVGRRTLGEGA
jgi:AbrB family looped-hinge helix DNA binding protein